MPTRELVSRGLQQLELGPEVVDYTLVPKRLTPGYEHRLSTGAMVATFGALAAGFALGAFVTSAASPRSPLRG